MFSFDSLGHINVVVPDLEEATRLYQALFRFFYAIDRYGIQWEFEEGHADIGTG
jgi:hypothetical protein